MKTILTFAIFLCLFGTASAECRLQEQMFRLPDSKEGNLVFQKLYSCDGKNWFKEPPAQETREVRTTSSYSSYSRRGYGKDYGGYGPPPPFYNRGYQGDSWLSHSGRGRTSTHRRYHDYRDHRYGVRVEVRSPDTRGQWRLLEDSIRK